jgi:hypothetical protein
VFLLYVIALSLFWIGIEYCQSIMRKFQEGYPMKNKLFCIIVLVFFLLTSACSTVKSFFQTSTPTPTETPTKTATITPTPTRTRTPTPKFTPTPTHPPYSEGLANYTDPSIPVLQPSEIPALLSYLDTLPSKLKPDASAVETVPPATNGYGNSYFRVACIPGSCAVVATVKLDAGTVMVDGVRQDMRPVINIWQVMTKNGPAWLLDYAYDPVQSNGPTSYDYLMQYILADGTFDIGIIRTYSLGFSLPSNQEAYSYYYSLLGRPEYAHVWDLVQQWSDTGIMPPQLQRLILAGSGK